MALQDELEAGGGDGRRARGERGVGNGEADFPSCPRYCFPSFVHNLVCGDQIVAQAALAGAERELGRHPRRPLLKGQALCWHLKVLGSTGSFPDTCYVPPFPAAADLNEVYDLSQHPALLTEPQHRSDNSF